jgi:competence protein ComEC
MQSRASDQSPTPAFVRARHRAWGALAAGLIGVWVSGTLGSGSAWWFGGALVLGLGAAVLPARRGVWGPAAAGAMLCVLAGWSAVRFREPPLDRVDRMVAEGAIVTVTGIVTHHPERRERSNEMGAPGYWMDDSAWLRLRVTGVEGTEGTVAARGELRVSGGVGLLDRARAGDRVRVTGVFRGPSRASNPGEPDWMRLGNEAGRAGALSVGEGSLLTVEGRPEGWRGVRAGLVRLRAAIRTRALNALGDAAGGGVVGALVLGERDDSFEAMYRVFQRAGVAHVLAVSGFHLAMLCGLAALAVRVTGDRGRLETIAIVAVVVVMLLFVPARSPIVRAGVLALALILGDVLGRRWDRLAVLAWAGLALLAWKPSEAMSLGYLLSVGVTALLIALAERDRRDRWWLIERQKPGGAGRRAGRWLWGALRLNTACWAASTPIIIAATGVFSPLAPIATIVIVPVAGTLLVVGWAQAVLGVAWPAAAARTARIMDWMGGVTGGVAGWFDALPGSSFLVVGVGWWWAAFVTAGVLGWLFRRAQRRVFVSMIALGVAYAVAMAPVAGRVDGLRADMFDVGDGTSVLIRTGNEALLWDCGSLQREVGGRVADAVIALGVRRVRTAVVTHPNLDHFNGLPEVAERLGIRRVLVPPEMVAGDEGGWGRVRERLVAMGVVIEPIHAGDAWSVGKGGVRVEVLWPPAIPSARLMANDRSVVARFTVPTAREPGVLLMTGDVQRAGIAGLMASGVDTRATVIEVPHHGSAIPQAMELVSASGASVALQSTGPSRLNDERWDAVRAGRWWLSTAEGGAVYAWIRADGALSVGSIRE